MMEWRADGGNRETRPAGVAGLATDVLLTDNPFHGLALSLD